ncbi:MAG: hypothetical protein GY723_02660 [bacterium]|nr:hypothetical protein [bacterium]MCP5070870.1 hypothetical protein [bacterium]
MSEPRYRRTVLMGDPAHFSVQGGANPHTRDRWGRRRSVDRAKAIVQWHRLRDTLRDLGVHVLVVPPDPAQPGLVYPANAGFQTDLDAELPLDEKTFYLANLLPTRAGEKAHYRRVLEPAGFRLGEIDEQYRMEGEADFFPAGTHHLLTFGGIEKQRFVPALAWPPWKRVYGFRTDIGAAPFLESLVAPRPVLQIRLSLEAHYHGDTALCAFGPNREYLLAYRESIESGAWSQLETLFGDHLIPLSVADAERYAANSFTLSQHGASHLILPGGVSDALLGQIRERNVSPITVDVSEFLKKGGGSVKCMIGDLGPVAVEQDLGMHANPGG